MDTAAKPLLFPDSTWRVSEFNLKIRAICG
jgi:hypothetical protein